MTCDCECKFDSHVWLHACKVHSLSLTVAGSGDYNVMAMDLTFSATVTTHPIAITAAADDILEVYEVFTLNLTTTADDTTVTLNPSSVTVTITDMTSEFITLP